jgi:predicted TIM-barrel fold metal-dependent hydrolase
LDTIDIFGPRRTMFGSNFPVDSLYSSFSALYTAFDEITGSMSEHDRRELFADTARRTYSIGPEPTTGKPERHGAAAPN